MRFGALTLIGFAVFAAAVDAASARDGCGRGLAWNGRACVQDPSYQPRAAPQPARPSGWGGDLQPNQPYPNGGQRPGTILGHGEAAGCVASFSRVVEANGGTACREIP
jgi:hypothetical protein